MRASGYLQTLDDFNHIVLKASENGVPVYLRDVAKVQIGPEMRRGIAELNGEGEVAGGVVILRSGKNAREVIAAVKDKLETLKSSLPEGVEIVTTYDRSQLIDRAIDNLSGKVAGRVYCGGGSLCAVSLACALGAGGDYFVAAGVVYCFYCHALPGTECQYYVVGWHCDCRRAMVDAAIVMIENAHKRLKSGSTSILTPRWIIKRAGR